MFQSTVPVKFKGIEEKSGKNEKGPWLIKEAVLSVPEVGKVKVQIYDNKGKDDIKFPEIDQVISIKLSPVQGGYQALKLVWDRETVFTPVASPVKAAA